MLPIAAEIAVRLTREQAQSALPDAPVFDDTPRAPRPSGHRRVRAARALRKLADRLEPASARSCVDPRRGSASSSMG